jgi:hypothetical protein
MRCPGSRRGVDDFAAKFGASGSSFVNDSGISLTTTTRAPHDNTTCTGAEKGIVASCLPSYASTYSAPSSRAPHHSRFNGKRDPLRFPCADVSVPFSIRPFRSRRSHPLRPRICTTTPWTICELLPGSPVHDLELPGAPTIVGCQEKPLFRPRLDIASVCRGSYET